MSDHPIWPADFDFYMATIAGLPAQIMVDLGARPVAPVSSLPVRLMVRAIMKQARDDGLRSTDEEAPLAVLEHQLGLAVQPLGLRLLGRVIYQGWMDLVFYAPATGDPKLLHEAIVGARGEYEVRVAMEHDAEWGMYLEFLYPTDPKAIQAMKNRRIFQRLVVAGDDPKVPRLVNHTAAFPDIITAVAAQQRIRDIGFDGPFVEQAGEERWELTFSREESLLGGAMDVLCAQIIDLIVDAGGVYEGWGTMAMSRELPPEDTAAE